MLTIKFITLHSLTLGMIDAFTRGQNLFKGWYKYLTEQAQVNFRLTTIHGSSCAVEKVWPRRNLLILLLSTYT
jgi:ABC-type antimicrobial peptide transport system permease subunit